jgi:hypothetical protein
MRIALHGDSDAGRLLDILNIYNHIYGLHPGTKMKEIKESNAKEVSTIGFTGTNSDA